MLGHLVEFFIVNESRLKTFNIIDHSTLSDDYLRHLILLGKEKKRKKIEAHPNKKFLSFTEWLEQQE